MTAARSIRPDEQPARNIAPDRARISVVLAAYNEEGAVGGVISGVRDALPEAHEILVVDDGSADGTAREAERAGARVVRLPRSGGGKGRALRVGIASATGDVLVFLDADGQDDPAEIPRLLAALEPGVDMVIGSRFRGELLEGAITPINHVGNLALTSIFNVLHGARISDTQAGFRVVRRSALEPRRLAAVAYEIETELTMEVLRSGGRIVEVPVTRAPRNHGRTSFVRPYHGLRILAWMVAGRVARDVDRLRGRRR